MTSLHPPSQAPARKRRGSHKAVAKAAPEAALRPAGAQTPHRLARAAEIVVAAREAFLEHGFQGASVSQIAARVGVAEGLIYSYYPTKRALLDAVLEGMYAPLLRDLEDGLQRVQGLRSRLRFLVWRHLRVYVEEPKLSRLVLHEVRVTPVYFESVLHQLHVRYTSFIERVLTEAMQSGELSADTDVELVRSMVYGGIEHRMWAVLYGRGAVDVEQLADHLSDLLMRALTPPHPNPSTLASTPASIEARLERLERIVAGLASP